jgi:hypothetical protein
LFYAQHDLSIISSTPQRNSANKHLLETLQQQKKAFVGITMSKTICCIRQMKTSRLQVCTIPTKVIPAMTGFETRASTPVTTTFPQRQQRFSSCSIKDENDENLYDSKEDLSLTDLQHDVKEIKKKHCHTCTCNAHATIEGGNDTKNNFDNNNNKNKITHQTDDSSVESVDTATCTGTPTCPFPCGRKHHEDELDSLPDPLPDPTYSVHKRVLPKALTAFSSTEGNGRKLLEFNITLYQSK